jgi:iron complex outermembrane receptor protein
VSRALTLAVVLLGGLAAPLLAQNAVIRGRVMAPGVGTPVSGADVIVSGTARRAETDSTGWFELRDLAPGSVELLIREPGYEPARVRLSLAPGEVKTLSVLLVPATPIVDPITVTATRDPRSLSSVAAAVSVADSQAIQSDRTVGLDESLRMMPGVQARSRYGTDDVNLGIRGSAARGRQAVRGVAVLLDGVPLSEPDGAARLDLIELAAARQVEVVRGPVSALYAGSASGVVNVISRSGHDSPGVTLQAQGGSYGFEKYVGQAGAVIDTGQGSVYLAGSYTKADNYRAHSAGSVARGLLRTDFHFPSRTDLTLDAEGSRLDTDLPGSLNQTQFDANPDAAAPSAVSLGFGRADSRYRAGARLVQGLGASGNTEASAYGYYGGRTLYFPTQRWIVDLNFQRTQVGARYRAARVGGAALELAAGVDYDHVHGTDQRWTNSGGLPSSLLDRGTDAISSLGIYGQGDWRVSRSVDLTLGLRYDAVSYGFTSSFPGMIPAQDTTFDQWSPKLTGSWQAGSKSLAYASIARGFEVPAVGELSASPGAALSTTLHPKTLWNYEVGARGMVGPTLRFDAAVFYADVDGEFVPVNSNGVSLPENASQSRNVGIELGVIWLAARWLDVSATYTFSDFRLLDYATTVTDSAGNAQPVVYNDKQMPTIPQSRITADIVTRPLAALSLGMQFEWQSQMYVETGNQEVGVTYFHPPPSPPGTIVAVPFRAVPARALVQLNGRYQWGPVGVFASIDNLFGTVYTANVVANDLNGAYYEAGSGTWVSLGASVSLWPSAH